MPTPRPDQVAAQLPGEGGQPPAVVTMGKFTYDVTVLSYLAWVA